MGHYTDAPEDNLLGLTTHQALNEAEALGVARAEAFLTELDYPLHITTAFLRELHRVAFSHLYDWAGMWRTTTPNVGTYVPPAPVRIPQLMYEFEDELRFRMSATAADHPDEVARLLAFAHHRLVFIHPFTNGNGRTARLLTNALAYHFGFAEVVLYQREAGDSRARYLHAIRQGDHEGPQALAALIRQQLRPLV